MGQGGGANGGEEGAQDAVDSPNQEREENNDADPLASEWGALLSKFAEEETEHIEREKQERLQLLQKREEERKEAAEKKLHREREAAAMAEEQERLRLDEEEQAAMVEQLHAAAEKVGDLQREKKRQREEEKRRLQLQGDEEGLRDHQAFFTPARRKMVKTERRTDHSCGERGRRISNLRRTESTTETDRSTTART